MLNSILSVPDHCGFVSFFNYFLSKPVLFDVLHVQTYTGLFIKSSNKS